MQLSDFSYDLPEELIARYPLAERSASRLLCLSPRGIRHQQVKDLPQLLQSNDLLVCNNTKVIPARLLGHKATGGRVEVLVERILSATHMLAQVRSSKSPKPGSQLCFANGVELEVLGRQNDLFELRCADSHNIWDILNAIGQIPLPPYFYRSPEESDKERYQTIYAKQLGSVASPTAGLHFDEALLKALQKKGVQQAFISLHIGAGTFSPVRTENITEHRMHAEYMEITPELCQAITQTKARGGRIVAVGTTSARALETASLSGEIKPYTGDTDIFIYPGFKFNCVDILMTNMHLPGSTLLMLVSAFGGYQAVMEAYKQAVALRYRFFSYGDAMLIHKA